MPLFTSFPEKSRDPIKKASRKRGLAGNPNNPVLGMLSIPSIFSGLFRGLALKSGSEYNSWYIH
jgi:hypothetical protein